MEMALPRLDEIHRPIYPVMESNFPKVSYVIMNGPPEC